MNLLGFILHPLDAFKAATDYDKLVSDAFAGKNIEQDALDAAVDTLNLIVDGILPPPAGVAVDAIKALIVALENFKPGVQANVPANISNKAILNK
jgi:hypothetical protein